MSIDSLTRLCRVVRYNILTSTTAAGSGHPTTSLSAVELMTTLFFGGFLRLDLENPHYIFNDRVIFSKGHAAPLLYSLYQAAGAISREELLTLRKFGSNLEGHPSPRFKYADVTTGSLGQGLSIGVGMALGIKLMLKNATGVEKERLPSARTQGALMERNSRQNLSRHPNVFVLLGDSEVAEGQVWEAMEIASHYKLNNLIAILDVNRLGQRGETMLGWDLKTYQKRAEAFGWNVIVVKDGHNLKEVNEAFNRIQNTERVSRVGGPRHARSETSTGGGINERQDPFRNRPTIIIAKTIKGKGISFLEDKDNWHGKAVPKDKLDEALKELCKVDLNLTAKIKKPTVLGGATRGALEWGPALVSAGVNSGAVERQAPTPYELGSIVATREAYGDALVALGEIDPTLVVLDAETSNSTLADKFKNKFPDRFFEMYIAEQNMTSLALGLSKLGFNPYISTFAAFLTRAYDQIRMTQYSEAKLKVCGSHAGTSIGADGASQMGLEDISMFRSLLESTVFYPSDAVSTYRIVEQSGRIPGVVYIRSTREKTPVLYKPNEKFTVGGSKILKQSKNDVAVIFTAGITVHEALKAYEELKKEKINICVVDLYSIKPIDSSKIQDLTSQISNVIVVEDHYPAGGLGEAVLSALSKIQDRISKINFIHLTVSKLPRSGSPEELFAYEEIDAAAIIKSVKKLSDLRLVETNKRQFLQ